MDAAQEAIDLLPEHEVALNRMQVYLSGNGNVIPREQVDSLLDAAGCDKTDWSEIDIDLVEGWEDLGNGRKQGSLF